MVNTQFMHKISGIFCYQHRLSTTIGWYGYAVYKGLCREPINFLTPLHIHHWLCHGAGMERMQVLDLFSGIGGFSLGLEAAGMETVGFCEVAPFCQQVLRKHWPHVPIHEDVRELDGRLYAGVDVICGGFPCQDISAAGHGAGIVGERSGLWGEFARIIGQARPRWVIVENVPLLRRRGLAMVLSDLLALGYDAEWHCIPASAVGAPHRRDRLWIVAHRGFEGGLRVCQEPLSRQPAFSWCENVRSIEELRERALLHTPILCGAGNGILHWVDRLRAVGNAVVPQVVEYIGRQIIACSRETDPAGWNAPPGEPPPARC